VVAAWQDPIESGAAAVSRCPIADGAYPDSPKINVDIDSRKRNFIDHSPQPADHIPIED
jgi:hypothetical protein